jgi:hypothetical protein
MNKPLERSAAEFVHPEDEPTIELVLSAEDVAALTRAAEEAQSTSRPVPPATGLTLKVPQGQVPARRCLAHFPCRPVAAPWF